MKWQIIVTLFALICMPQILHAKTWAVAKGGVGDFAVIQEAIDVSAPGDTIQIGPGRFSEYRTYTYTGGDWFVYVNVVIENLTLIGAGAGQTLIGPESQGTWELGDNSAGIVYGLDVSSGTISVAELSITDVVWGSYVDRGVFSFVNLAFSRGVYGAVVYVEGVFSGCSFEGESLIGISTHSPAKDVNVVECSFVDSRESFNFQLTENVSLLNCTIERCLSAGQFDRSSGEARGNIAQDGLGAGIVVVGSGALLFADNVLDGGLYNLVVSNGANNLTCLGNVFKNAELDAINIANCTPVINNNHIFKGGEYAVKIEGYSQSPLVHVDLKNNYWGTTEADSILAWIYDSNDQIVPSHYGVVDFEPFSAVPVPNDDESFGSFKAMFR